MIERLYLYYERNLSLQSRLSAKSRRYINAFLCLSFFINAGSICFAGYCALNKNLLGMIISILTASLSLYGAYFFVTYFVVRALKKHKKFKGICMSRFSYSGEKHIKWQKNKMHRGIKSEGVVSNDQVYALIDQADQLAKAERVWIMKSESIATIIAPVLVSYIDKILNFSNGDFSLLSVMFLMLSLLVIAAYIVWRIILVISDRVFTRYSTIMEFKTILSGVYFEEQKNKMNMQ